MSRCNEAWRLEITVVTLNSAMFTTVVINTIRRAFSFIITKASDMSRYRTVQNVEVKFKSVLTKGS